MREQAVIQSLTGLRFIAAFYVFLFHIHLRWPLTSIPFLKNILDAGAIGMSVFFILSGYLLVLRYHNKPSQTSAYMKSRFARIYPVYVVAGIVTLPWLNIDLGGPAEQFIAGIKQILFIFLANLFVIQAWFPPLFSHWNNNGSWSISVEVFCYACLPFILPHLTKLSIRQLIITSCILYFLSVMFGMAETVFPGYGIPVFYAMPIYRIPEFIIGGCAFLIVKQTATDRSIWPIQLFILATLIIYLGTMSNTLSIYVGHNWLVVPAITLIIISLHIGGGPLEWLLSRPLLVWLGKISYCFYSFQALVILILVDNHEAITQTLPFISNAKALALTAFAILTLISALAFYAIEETSRNLIERYWKTRENVKYLKVKSESSYLRNKLDNFD